MRDMGFHHTTSRDPVDVASKDDAYPIVYLSLTSLTLNASCRALFFDTLFFSVAHKKLRDCLIGSRNPLTDSLLLCPNGPNKKPARYDLVEASVDGKADMKETSCPSFEEYHQFGILRLDAIT